MLSKLDGKAEEKVMKEISVKDIMTDISTAMEKSKAAASSTKNSDGANAAG